jgi:hypothetical protein
MLVSVTGVALPAPVLAQYKGPGTTTEPYVLPTIKGVSTTSILTTGDSIGGYRMAGIPDGLGVWEEGEKTFNLVSNHELGKALGVLRAHGSTGAFVSRWVIERGTGKVLSGRDHLTGPNDVLTWNGAYVPGTTAFDRLCSADLAGKNAYFLNGEGEKEHDEKREGDRRKEKEKDERGRLGTPHRIFLSGEETSPPSASDHGRVFAHVVTGPEMNKSYQLPRLGRMSIENAVASPFSQAKTIVMLNDDAGRETDVTVDKVCRASPGQAGCIEPPSELYVYVGTKQNSGNEIERAGLANGNLYGVRVKANGAVVTGENKDFVFGSGPAAVTSARFELVNLGDVSGKTGVQIEDDSIANQVTQFIRIEDGAWDPREGKERDYYFVTTGRITASASTWRPSRLWRLRFDDIARPEDGGVIEMLLTNQFYPGAATTPDADPSYQMFDNMTIDRRGRIVLQEDVGGNDRLGRIYVYGIDSKKLQQVAVHNSKFFGGNAATNPNFLTNDEESSGVIDASHFLGEGWFLMTVQNHKPSGDADLVEGGQYVGLYIDPAIGRK